MAIEQIRQRYVIYDYDIYDKTKILSVGEIRYFNNVEPWIINNLSIIGDGSSQIQFLPFREIIIIETSTGIALDNLRISGNKVLIQNTGSTIIQINIGTSPSPIYVDVQPNITIFFKFNGTAWIPISICNQKLLERNYTISDTETFQYYKINTTTNQFVNITLPLFVNNQNKLPFYIQNTGSGIVKISTSGADTINGLTEIRLYSRNNFIEVYPGENEWNIKNQDVYIDSGKINRTDWMAAKLGHVVVGYDNITLGNPKTGGFIEGQTSGVIGKIVTFGSANIRLIEITGGGIFQNDETIIGIDFDFEALVNEPTGNNLNKDTNIHVLNMGNKIQKLLNDFIIYTTDNDTTFLKNISVAYRTTTPLANEYSGLSFYYIDNNQIALMTGIDGISVIINIGALIGQYLLIDTEDYYYRIITRIFY